MTTSTDFLVSRTDLHQVRLAETPLPSLATGQVLARVGQFALTANNITYAAFGDAMMYWNFFEAPDGWGRIPVWGFADIVESKVDGVRPGERIYGYFPMSTHLVMEPGRISEGGFTDRTARRQKMAAVYNNYLRTATDPAYDPAREAEQALLRPLFMTSFFIDDFLADNDFFGAREVLISSASSKTSLSLAFLLQSNRRGQVSVVGLTSRSNAAFVESTRYYDRVVTYDAIGASPNDTTSVFVDMAGSGEIRSSVHHHWNDSLKYSCSVGATHWEQMAGGAGLPGPKPTLFFAPEQIRKRGQDWGPGGIEHRVSQTWKAFIPSVDRWMKIERNSGAQQVEAVYRQVLDGKSDPSTGHILAL